MYFYFECDFSAMSAQFTRQMCDLRLGHILDFSAGVIHFGVVKNSLPTSA